MTGITPDLLNRCKKGDRKAQSTLYECCFGFLMSTCLRYTRNEDDAHSYLNLAFYKILTKLDSFKIDLSFQAWSKKVLINSILDEIRKDKRYRQHVSLEEESSMSSQGNPVLFETEAVSAEEIYAYIRSLPPMTATVFNLYAIDGYKHKEIGKQLGMSDNTSKWHYHEARRKLQMMVLEGLEKKKEVNAIELEKVEIDR